ncbi:hypothetical protein GCM10010425_65470 [Streptomyces spororaveus]
MSDCASRLSARMNLPGGPSGDGSTIVAMWRRKKQDKPDRTPAEWFTAPLMKNMPEAGDFSYEAIQKLGNPVPMLVTNNGDELLELWLEPFGQDYWLRPGDAFMVTSYGHWDDHPFETIHEPNRITVWATSWFATVSDADGNEVPGGHERLEGIHE